MKYQNKLSVSVMCSDLMNLGREIGLLRNLGTDMLHMDIMDAHFVPNLTFGPDFISAIQNITDLPVDCHFMVTDPELMFGKLKLRREDIFSAHAELTDEAGKPRDYSELAKDVHSSGALFGLALNPETPVENLERNLQCLDTVTLMLVHPGFAGSKMVDGIMEKVRETREYLDARGYDRVEISVDGSVSAERAAYMAGLGASIFVGGTAGIYIKGKKLEDTIPEFKKCIGG
jgi:ribulose-phosphate 3-epimerase